MQQGSVIREHRKLGPDVWCFRWWESGPNGNRVHRRIVLGTAEQMRDVWGREINSFHRFLNPSVCYNRAHVPLLPTRLRSHVSPLSPPWQFGAGEPRPSPRPKSPFGTTAESGS